eukprot:CAMPEP_0113400712 /NCGR_PEP_ID=MMETSP0013_2-20120614/16282_1 /TAXON_ID=2843 ORGANISM="Skeletonema costatum, Strain 1716" /NCGR_SAMPLE_ID=MMETSP0013_2 /ASSEMBLY_ACC=CAM_ASM_000158 /LENGTH=331 /DNA_ID=CAMNT_0000285825 /DNA_START=217 /DNA_END=1212 /DNA_ORIENTATION=- /assembly_acc=CAM_ASM_000158
MKSEVNRISNLFLTEMKLLSLILSSIRRHKHNAASVLSISFILFFAGRGITEAHLPAIPFLRGGYSSYSVPAAKPMGLGMKPIGKLYGLSNLKRTLTHIGEKIRLKPKQTQSKEAAGNQHLDEVLGAFTHVLNGNDIDTAQLLKACKAHLKLMKSGGASLRLVAKDLESNLLKAEKPFKKAPKKGKTLYSLLESERHSGIHKEGNELENESAAMGLLWIRRSLAFQLDLFESSLLSENGKHPGVAAIDAYEKHLSPYHGWMLQKVFPLSLSAMPKRSSFISAFGGRDEPISPAHEEEIVRKLSALLKTWRPIIKRWSNDFESLNLEDTRPA